MVRGGGYHQLLQGQPEGREGSSVTHNLPSPTPAATEQLCGGYVLLSKVGPQLGAEAASPSTLWWRERREGEERSLFKSLGWVTNAFRPKTNLGIQDKFCIGPSFCLSAVKKKMRVMIKNHCLY